ncbi:MULTISPECIES: transposase [Sphingobacterium]|uniref:transposase n=1 Tax=Sphingobacterium TaxID=28453 RepID=UPI0028ADE907|nr:transposase [Sphingobacterium multivorum]
MARIRHVIGVDISKKTLDLALFFDGEYAESFKIENTPESILAFEKQIKSLDCKVSNTIFCAEDTGVYGTFLKRFATKSKWKFCFDSALRIRWSIGIVKGKNDKADAKRIGDYAVKNLKNLKFYLPKRPVIEELKYYNNAVKRLAKVKKELLASKKCYREFEVADFSNAYIATMSSIEKDINKIEDLITSMIDNDQRLSELQAIVCSVPGVGKKLFLEIIIATNEFKDFDCPRKFASYAAVAPFRDTSGTSVSRRSRTSKIGNPQMKALLHMGSIACLRNKQSHIYKYYVRRKAEKYTGFRLMNALRNKMIHTIFACVKNMQQYQSTGNPLK